VPKLTPADAACDADDEEDADDEVAGVELDACVLVVPARLQPAASKAVAAMAAAALMAILTGFLLDDVPRLTSWTKVTVHSPVGDGCNPPVTPRGAGGRCGTPHRDCGTHSSE
jgi:hypothetical protein